MQFESAPISPDRKDLPNNSRQISSIESSGKAMTVNRMRMFNTSEVEDVKSERLDATLVKRKIKLMLTERTILVNYLE